MINKKSVIILILSIVLILLASNLLISQNEYEKKFLGTWEMEEETELVVLEENNIVYMIDIDGIRATENGRWKATATQISIELKYNGKKYRMVYKYEFLDEDTVELEIVVVLEDGKETEQDELQKGKKYIMKRWEE